MSSQALIASADQANPKQHVAAIMGEVISCKEAKVQSSLKGRVNSNEAVMIGGDLFTLGYLTFQVAKIIKPALAAVSAIGVATLTCGVIAGAINIGVALISLKEALQAWQNGDKLLSGRLFLDFLGLSAIGTIMILASLALQVAALGAVAALFGLNPWLLPVLFFVISIPIIVEIANRMKNIHLGQDLGSQLKGDSNALLSGTDPQNPYHLQPLIHLAQNGGDREEIRKALAQKMEVFQADIGVEAALDVFRWMRLVLLEKEEQATEQLTKADKSIEEWNRAQYVRMFQQALYIAAFVVSMGMLSPTLNTPAADAGQASALAAANATALYMDTWWPFKRNTPIVVPHVIDDVIPVPLESS